MIAVQMLRVMGKRPCGGDGLELGGDGRSFGQVAQGGEAVFRNINQANSLFIPSWLFVNSSVFIISFLSLGPAV
jgi:hypothetical protein